MNKPAPKTRPQKRRKRPKKGRSITPIVQGLALCMLGVAIFVSRADVAEKYHDLGTDSSVYALPSEGQLVVFSLGYRAAMADLLFGKTLVSAGVHFSERRVFHHLDAYLNGILALDRKYLDVYRYADTLLNLSTVEMPKENLRIARDILERGLEEFPHEPKLWMSSGQFMAYLAPQRLPPDEDPREWRLAGARILQHACDIWPKQEELPETCLSSSTLYSREGEIAAAIDSLQRLIAVTDDPRLRARAHRKLQVLAGQRAAQKIKESLEYLEPLRKSDLPAVDRLRYQLLSPPFDAHECIGLREPDARLKCATSFATRSKIIGRERPDD